MKYPVRAAVTALVLLAWSGSSPAGPILDSSEVSYDPGTGLYTYTYSLSLQQRAFVDGFSVLVARNRDRPGLAPLTQTAPAGWSFRSYYDSGLTLLPLNEALPAGVYWSWYIPFDTNPVHLPDRLTFSFTTVAAPTADYGANYLLGNSGRTGGAPYMAVETGSMSAPDLAASPEPSSLLLAGLGLAGAAVTGWRRRRQSRVPA